MKNNITFLFAVALALCAITKVNAQLTRQQAIQKVLNEIVVADTGKIDVYSVIPLKYYQDTIALPVDSTLTCPYNYNWVFFINDHPNATWAHECRYIFIDTVSGNYQINNQNFYPLAFETADSVDYDLVQQIYHYPAANIPPNQNTQTRTTTTNDHLYAVIIVTQDAVLNPHQEYHNFFWDDASAMFCTLINVYGYSKDHIYVHYYDGTSPRSGGDLDKDEPYHDYDIDYSASKSRIIETFDNLAGTSNSDPNIPVLTPSDQLFVFIEGHGINNGGHSTLACAYPGPYYDYLYDFELAQLVENINCAQMLFLIQPCFSGNFATALTDYNNYTVSCKNRSVHTATSVDLYSTTEFYMTNNRYMEYSFYWTAATRKGYPIFDEPWKTFDYEPGSFPFDQYYPFTDHPDDYDPDLNGDGLVQMEEAFAYADYMDAWSPNGYYHPDNYCWECYEEPVNKDKIGYDNGTEYNNLITLFGMAGNVLNDDLLLSNRNYMSGYTITVPEDHTFTIDDNSTIYLTGDDTKITVNEDCDLDLNDNVTVNNNQIDINGNLTVGKGVTFNNTSINLLNSDMSTDFDQTTFNSAELNNYGQSLTISNSTFQGYLMAYSHNGNVSVSNTSFNNTWLYIENQSNTPGLTANVNNCTFQTVYTMAAIDLWGYDKFNIINNTMHGYYNGIQMFSSGNGASGNQNIFGNEMYNNTMSGILIYNSTASISSNYIHNNKYGIRLNDNSNIALYGNPGSHKLR